MTAAAQHGTDKAVSSDIYTRVAPRADGATVLSFFVALLLLIPSQFIIGPLGGAGTPAQILGVLGLLWWSADRIRRTTTVRSFSPRTPALMAIFGAAVLASYVAGTTRPISDDELRSMQMGVLSVLAWLGIVLVASYGIPSRERLEVLLRRLTVLGGLVALLGVVQFITGRSFVDQLTIPGLTTNHAIGAIDVREGFQRPAGTSIHAIEFGAVLTMVLPIALHFALYDTHRPPWRRWWPAAAIGVMIPISISRSAIVCAVTVLAMLIPTWPKMTRRWALIVLMGGGSAAYLFLPGLLGTVTGLFTSIGSDTSAASRTGSYPLAWQFIERAPFFGRGFLTFLPDYRILDNQYLGSLIDIGFVGVGALLLVFGGSIVTVLRVRRRLIAPSDRHLAQALAAAVAAGGLSFAMFDAFSFPMAAALVFFFVGCVGSLRSCLFTNDGTPVTRSGP